MTPHQSTPNPPAKRLFLVVGDGLRADTAFAQIQQNASSEPEFLAPYLRSLVLHNATYGISHTRMPTESRPGHVAMIAGFYEDVSAVTKGWKENPVDFDSVFNQSKRTFSFGLPDILPMFSQGASHPDKVRTWMYGHEFEDFTKLLVELDAYVFDHLEDLFQNASRNATLDRELREEKVVFFLHLLGCDTAGHSYRPYLKEYYENVRYLDTKLQELVPRVREFFGDDDTAFVVTADHGMSALGSHGDGHPNNTRTPLVAFGAGLNTPLYQDRKPYFAVDDAPEVVTTDDWYLDLVQRHDVQQADISPLMSYLIGVPYAANNVGRLPLSYINASPVEQLEALYRNALSITEQYIVKERAVRRSQLAFKPYPAFEEKSISERTQEIEKVLDQVRQGSTEKEDHGIELAHDLIDASLEGLTYLQTYNWRLLRTTVVLGFVGWIVYSFVIFLSIFVLHGKREEETRSSTLSLSIFYALGTALLALFYFQQLPLMYYIYGAFPVFLWQQVFAKKQVLFEGTALFFKGIGPGARVLLLLVIVAVFEGIVYGFFNRKAFSVMFVVLGLYPLFSGIGFSSKALWMVNCLCMTGFTWSDAIKTETLSEINAGVILTLLFSSGALWRVASSLSLGKLTISVLTGQILLIVGAAIATNISVVSLQAREGLPLFSQVLGWLVIIISLTVMPLLHTLEPSLDLRLRLLTIFVTFAPIFTILTISFELLFYVGFSALIIQWIEIETTLKRAFDVKKDNKAEDWLQVLRVSVIGFFLAQIAFFGTGNIASISSFALDSVRRLIPVFDPFSMGALLMVKLIIPYVLLSAGLGVLNVSMGIKTFTISTLIICISDVLSLNFFFLVKTEGSWLDIGMTILNYCVAILSSLFMLLLEYFSLVVLKGVALGESEKTPLKKPLLEKPQEKVLKSENTPIKKRLRKRL